MNFNGSNTVGSFTTAVLNSFLSPLENPIAADLELHVFRLIFFYILKTVYCVYSLESPR